MTAIQRLLFKIANSVAEVLPGTVSLLINGNVPKWDLSKVRPAEQDLRRSVVEHLDQEPLEDLFRFTVDTFRRSAGRKLYFHRSPRYRL